MHLSGLQALVFSRMRFLSATQADTQANSNTHIYMYVKNVKTRKWEQSGNRNIGVVCMRVQEGESIYVCIVGKTLTFLCLFFCIFASD